MSEKSRLYYVDLRTAAKYRSTRLFAIDTGFKSCGFKLEDCRLSPEGVLELFQNFLSDGPSGPTVDTNNSVRAGFAHDGWVRGMRLDKRFGAKKFRRLRRKQGRQLFYRILIEDGMCKARAWCWVRGLRWFGGGAVKPKEAFLEKVTPA